MTSISLSLHLGCGCRRICRKSENQDRIEDLIAFLDERTEAVIEYSEPLAQRLIEKAMVYDEKLVVEFKSGLQIEGEA